LANRRSQLADILCPLSPQEGFDFVIILVGHGWGLG
jgi:hypothetical protein